MITMIWCMDKNRLIGKDNILPWHFKTDFDFFKEKTNGKEVIVGENTYFSIKGYAKGKTVLPGRKINLVTPNVDLLDSEENISRVFLNLDEKTLSKLKESKTEYVVIGGRSVYEQFFPHADEIYITEIQHEYEGNIYFPELNMSEFKEEIIKKVIEKETELIFKKYTKIKKEQKLTKEEYDFLKQFQELAEVEQKKHATHAPIVYVKDINYVYGDKKHSKISNIKIKDDLLDYNLNICNIGDTLNDLFGYRYINFDYDVDTGIIVSLKDISDNLRNANYDHIDNYEKDIDFDIVKDKGFYLEFEEENRKLIVEYNYEDDKITFSNDEETFEFTVYYERKNEIVKAHFFTMKEAKDYIEYQSHNLNEPFVYVDYDGYGNKGEYRCLRNVLLKLDLDKFEVE